MRFLIVAFHPRTMTPYSKLYEDVIKDNNHDYDIVFWDRFTNDELEYKNNEYIIHKRCTLGGSKLKKILPMLYFRNVIKYILKQKKYEKIIVLNTLPGVLLNDILLSKYSGNYVFDIRDYTYEKYAFYKKIVDDLIDNSFFTSISSKGFMRFLNNNAKIYVNHNISNITAMDDFKAINLENKDTITIGFLGVLRYAEENKWLIQSLKNDYRYQLVYGGRKYPEIDFEEYCRKIGVTNCYFFGAFNNEDKPELYKNIDFINAVYGNKSLEVCCALPNKLYDSLIFKKPIVASEGTYLGEVVKENHLGFTIDINDDIKKKFNDYIANYNSTDFTACANKLLTEVVLDQNRIVERLVNFCCGS